MNKMDYDSNDNMESTVPAENDGQDSIELFEAGYNTITDISIEYELNWTSARKISIEQALESADESIRKELFQRLLEIDIAKGFENNVDLGIENYRARFPQWDNLVKTIYMEIAGQSQVINRGLVGKRIANFHILSILGHGGMGIVYEAMDLDLNRKVALKRLLPRLNIEDNIERFKNETYLQAMDLGPMFAKAYSIIQDQGYLYFAMEFIDGINLGQYYQGKNKFRKDSGPLPFQEAIEYINQVAEGLRELHKQNIIHRDIKPGNIMITHSGKICILDLGLGYCDDEFFQSRKEWDPQSSADSTPGSVSGKDLIVGTMPYLSPEGFFTPNQIDCRTDLYSLGATLFFLLTGRWATDWYNPSQTQYPQISLKQFFQQEKILIPKPVFNVLERLLKVDRDERYQTADEVCRDLNHLIQLYSPKTFYHRCWRFAVVSVFIMILIGSLIAYDHFSKIRNRTLSIARAEELYQQNNPAAALSLLVNLDANQLNSAQKERVFLFRGNLYSELAKDDDYLNMGIKEYSHYLKLCPDDIRAMEKQAELYLRKKEYELARHMIAQGLKRFPNDIPLNILDGKLNILQCETSSNLTEQKKKTLLDESIEILSAIPDSAKSLFWRARAYLLLHCEDFAINDLDKSLKLDPHFWPSDLWKATLRFNHLKTMDVNASNRKSEILAVTEQIQRILQEIPDFAKDEIAQCYDLLAQCSFWSGDYAKSVQYYDQIHALDKDFPLLPLRRGKALFHSIIKNNEAQGSEEQWITLLNDFEAITKQSMYQFLSEEDRVELLVLSAIACLHINDAQNKCIEYTNKVLQSGVKPRVYQYEKNFWTVYGIRTHVWAVLNNTEEVRKDSEKHFELIRKNNLPPGVIQ